MKKEIIKTMSELRQDPVFGDWVLLSPSRRRKHKLEGRIKTLLPKNKCPFETPAKFGNAPPVLVYQNIPLRGTTRRVENDWFLQIIPNKYPAVKHGDCGLISQNGLYRSQPGTGFHEIVIFRDHNRYLAQYSPIEIKTILLAYQDRYLSLAKEKCIKYISIFHNHGKEAGSTVPHPHSQILALPIVPPDVDHSINSSLRYFHQNQECIHCKIIAQELKENKRIVYQNEHMIVITPFASKANFEMRIFPKKHSAYFEKTSDIELTFFAEAMKFVFSSMHNKLKDPAFNFFIHTAPTDKKHDYNHYHWHMEILPKFNIVGSFELGTGLGIILVSPEEAAKILAQ